MDDERRELVRTLFVALTVQAEKCVEIGSQGQSLLLQSGMTKQLANDAIDITRLMSVISEAMHALVV